MNELQTFPVTQKEQDIRQPCERLSPYSDLVEHCRHYAGEKPHVVALWCLGIGFALGWKLKPW